MQAIWDSPDTLGTGIVEPVNPVLCPPIYFCCPDTLGTRGVFALIITENILEKAVVERYKVP